MTPSRIWIAAVVLYAAFFSWYTSWGGPLTEAEISDYVARFEAAGVEPERLAVWLEFMRTDTGDDFAMLNAIDYRDRPEQVPGVQPGESSEDVLRRYTTPFLGRALRSASHPIFIGDAASPSIDVWGIDGAEALEENSCIKGNAWFGALLLGIGIFGSLSLFWDNVTTRFFKIIIT